MKALRLMASVAVVGLMACGGDHKTAAESAPAAVTAKVATVRSVEVARQVELFGTVEAARSAVVSSRVMETVIAVPVRQGDAV